MAKKKRPKKRVDAYIPLSPKEKKARAIIGRDYYDSARLTFGAKITARIAAKVAALEKRKNAVVKAAAKKTAASAKELGLSYEEAKAYVIQARARPAKVKILEEDYRFAGQSGPRKNRFEVIREGRTAGFITEKQWKARLKRQRYELQIAALQKRGGFTRSEARRVVSDVKKTQLKALEKFKKTAKFKKLSPRKKRLYTKERWAFIGDVLIRRLLGMESPKMGGFSTAEDD